MAEHPDRLTPAQKWCLDLLRHWGGARRRDLLAAGVDPAGVRTLRERRLILPAGRGLYYAAGSDPRHPVLMALQAGGLLTCVSALRLHGIRAVDAITPPPGAPLHVTEIRRAAPAPMSSAHHRSPARPMRPGLVRLRDAVAHLLHCQDELICLIVLDDLFRRGALAREAVLADLPGRRNAPLRELVMQAVRTSESPVESIVHYHLRRAGWSFRCQVEIPGVGCVDFLIEGRVVLEVDGYEFHSDSRAFIRDRERDLRLEARGYRVVRVAAATVFRRWEETMRELSEVVRRASGR